MPTQNQFEGMTQLEAIRAIGDHYLAEFNDSSGEDTSTILLVLAYMAAVTIVETSPSRDVAIKAAELWGSHVKTAVVLAASPSASELQ